MSEQPSAHPDTPVEPALALSPLPKDRRLYEEPVRGGWLTFLLVMKFIGNASLAITYVLVICGVLSIQGRGPFVVLVYLVLVMANLTAVAAIWNWQRWGFYLLVASSIAIFTLNLSLGFLRWSTAMGLIGPLLVAAAVLPRWQSFA